MNFDRIVLDPNIYIAFKRTFIADIFFEHGKTIYSCHQQIAEYQRVARWLLTLKHVGKIQIIDPDYFKSIL